MILIVSTFFFLINAAGCRAGLYCSGESAYLFEMKQIDTEHTQSRLRMNVGDFVPNCHQLLFLLRLVSVITEGVLYVYL